MDYHTTSAVLGVSLALTILYLIRRDHLHIGHALFWIAGAFAVFVFGLFPQLSDRLALLVGVNYGPTLVFAIAVAMLIIKALHSDIAVTRIERDLRRLAQRLAIYESEGAGEPRSPRP